MENLSPSPQNLAKKLTWLWILLLILPFVITAFIHFSCFPMITSGKLRQVCYTKSHIADVITDFRTHGNTLYKIARDAVFNKDQDLLKELRSNLERPRVDYDSQILREIIDGTIIPPPPPPPPCTDPSCKGPCKSKLARNIGLGILTGLTFAGIVLTVGSGGLLAPIAAGAALAGGTSTTWLVEQFSKCP